MPFYQSPLTGQQRKRANRRQMVPFNTSSSHPCQRSGVDGGQAQVREWLAVKVS